MILLFSSALHSADSTLSNRPYEDLAFTIVNKDWERGHQRGFRSSFDRGVLQLHFSFKRTFCTTLSFSRLESRQELTFVALQTASRRLSTRLALRLALCSTYPTCTAVN